MLLNGVPYGGVLGTIVPPQSGGRSCSQADVRSTGRSGWSAWRLHQEQGFSSTTWKTWGCRFCGRSGHWKAACTTGLLCFACRRAGAHCPYREEPPGRDLVLSDKLVVYDLENQGVGWVNYDCTSSVEVEDESSGKIYNVDAHDIPASNQFCPSPGAS